MDSVVGAARAAAVRAAARPAGAAGRPAVALRPAVAARPTAVAAAADAAALTAAAVAAATIATDLLRILVSGRSDARGNDALRKPGSGRRLAPVARRCRRQIRPGPPREVLLRLQ